MVFIVTVQKKKLSLLSKKKTPEDLMSQSWMTLEYS